MVETIMDIRDGFDYGRINSVEFQAETSTF